MIQIYRPDNTTFSKNGDTVLFCERCDLTAELNGTWVLNLEIPIDPDGRWKLVTENAVLKVPTWQHDEQLYRIRKVTKTEDGVTATAYPIFYDSANDCFLLDCRPTGKTGQQALDIMCSGSPYSGVSNISTAETAYFVRRNLLSAIAGTESPTFLERWGGEIEFNNFQIIVNNRIGGDYGAEARYGLNILGSEYTVDTTDLVTRIVPVSFNGHLMSGASPWVDSTHIQDYPTVHTREIRYEQIKMAEDVQGDVQEGDIICTTQAQLDTALAAAAQADLATMDTPFVSMDIDMLAIQEMKLKQTETITDTVDADILDTLDDALFTIFYQSYKTLVDVRLGDTVRCRHYKLDITSTSRVVGLTWDCIRKRVTHITLGDFKADYVKQMEGLSERVNSVLRPDGSLIAEKVKGFIDSSQAQLRAQYNIAQHADVLAILYENFDTTSPMYGALGIGTQGISISKTRTQDGKGWVWTTGITANGMNADMGVFGILADKVGKNYINLDTGAFHFGDSTNHMTFDPSTGNLDLRVSSFSLAGSSISEIANGAAAGALSDAEAYTDALDNSLNQLGVFNRLTNNGDAEGIFLDNGELYINMSYLRSGAISVGKTVGGTFHETFYASSDGTVRIVADSFSLSTGETLASTLASANSYADVVGSSTLSSAEAYTDTLDTSLNQAEVFKRLTNNRQNQGIYIDNGNLYINASMIGAGTISADRIGANTIDVSKLNVSSLSAISADLGDITAGSINITGTGTGAGTITLSNGSLTATNVNLTGAITATSGSFTGSINATSGTFSGTISAGTYLGLPNTGMQVTSGGGLSGGGLSIGTTGISASTSGGASFNLTNGGAMTVTGGTYTGSVQNGSSIGALPVISTGLSYTSGSNTMSFTTGGLSMGGGVSLGVDGTGKISNIVVDTNAIYSTGHNAYDSTTAGFYFGSDGSFGVGNSGSYMRFHNGSLDIRCATFSLAGQGIGDIASSYATAAENNSKSYADELLDAGESYTDTKMAVAEANAKSYTDTKISQLPPPATLNQENVFNALTNNGRNQGIYLQSGELYINATYIASGTIAAGRIAASSIEASKLNITSLDHIANMMSGVHIESNKIYSGSHNTFNSTSAGFYLGSDGAFGVGNDTNYVRFNTSSGQVDIKCSAFTLSGSSIQAIAQGEAYTAQLAAQSYADSQIADSADELQTYADNLAIITADEVLDASESYADSILDAGKSYADSLFDDCKAYTDDEITVVQQSIPELTQNSVFNALIGGNPANQGVYLTQDGKVYINAECIGAGTIGADRIGANSITAGKLSVTSLDAISANLGNITAGSITIGSGNYSFGLASNGKLTCSGADIRGYVGSGITLDGASSKITLSGYRGDSYINGSTGEAAFGELKTYRNLTVGELLTSGTGNITAYGNITSYGTIYQGNAAVALSGHTHGFSDLTGVAASTHTHTEFNSAIDFKCNTTFFSGYTHAFHGTVKLHNLSSVSSNSIMCFGNDGATVCYTSASSKRYKDVVREMTAEDVEKAFNIQPVIAKYKEGYLAKDDERNGVSYPMFIAEDVERYIPEAADHRDGKTEDWNTRVMIPVMFQMIKSLKAELEVLKSGKIHSV